ATYYNTGLGSCGVTNVDTDYVVALSTQENGSHARCNQKIMVHYGGKSVAATVVDLCPSCSPYSIDLSPAAFEGLASKDLGRIQVSWEYMP
ncbi:hypothetical protein CPC08DRAFT_773826, partial [Agrocybe pediades]